MFHLPVTLPHPSQNFPAPALRADRTRPPKPIRGDFMVFLQVGGRKKKQKPFLQSIIFVIGFSLILQINCNKNHSPPTPTTYLLASHPTTHRPKNVSVPVPFRTWKQWALIAFNKSYNLTLRGWRHPNRAGNGGGGKRGSYPSCTGRNGLKILTLPISEELGTAQGQQVLGSMIPVPIRKITNFRNGDALLTFMVPLFLSLTLPRNHLTHIKAQGTLSIEGNAMVADGWPN